MHSFEDALRIVRDKLSAGKVAPAKESLPLEQAYGRVLAEDVWAEFLPAKVGVRDSDPVVEPVGWQGSGDLVGLATANCFMVIHPQQTEIAAGAQVDILLKPA
jgi:molybdopterin biosynthesis enzyme